MYDLYTEIKPVLGSSIESAVRQLLEHQEKGVLAKLNFNGITLFSDTVTLESAYKQITGKTLSEFESENEKRLREIEERQRAHEANIPTLIEKYKGDARSIISDDKLNEWDSIVPLRVGDLYHGWELDQSLQVIKLLNEGAELDVAHRALLDQDHSGISIRLVASIISRFADNERGQQLLTHLKL